MGKGQDKRCEAPLSLGELAGPQSEDSSVPGISQAAWERFQHGDCWILADAISRKTGWPIIVAVPEEEPDGEPLDHAAVRTPSGRLLDVSGLISEDLFVELAEMNGLHDSGDPYFSVDLREQSDDPGWRHREACPPELLDAVAELLVTWARQQEKS